MWLTTHIETFHPCIQKRKMSLCSVETRFTCSLRTIDLFFISHIASGFHSRILHEFGKLLFDSVQTHSMHKFCKCVKENNLFGSNYDWQWKVDGPWYCGARTGAIQTKISPKWNWKQISICDRWCSVCEEIMRIPYVLWNITKKQNNQF